MPRQVDELARYMDRATSKVWTAAFYPAYLVSFLALGPLFLVAD